MCNSFRLYNWPHSVDVGNVPEFSEKTYEVVRHAFLKVEMIIIVFLENVY